MHLPFRAALVLLTAMTISFMQPTSATASTHSHPSVSWACIKATGVHSVAAGKFADTYALRVATKYALDKAVAAGKTALAQRLRRQLSVLDAELPGLRARRDETRLLMRQACS